MNWFCCNELHTLSLRQFEIDSSVSAFLGYLRISTLQIMCYISVLTSCHLLLPQPLEISRSPSRFLPQGLCPCRRPYWIEPWPMTLALSPLFGSLETLPHSYSWNTRNMVATSILLPQDSLPFSCMCMPLSSRSSPNSKEHIWGSPRELMEISLKLETKEVINLPIP